VAEVFTAGAGNRNTQVRKGSALDEPPPPPLQARNDLKGSGQLQQAAGVPGRRLDQAVDIQVTAWLSELPRCKRESPGPLKPPARQPGNWIHPCETVGARLC